MVWGLKVGDAFTAFPPMFMNMVRSNTSSWAESSFLPPCLDIITEKV